MTLTIWHCKLMWLSFNPHTYMRCDLSVDLSRSRYLVFQSTHLHEVWPDLPVSFLILSRFQSTHLHEVWRCSVFTRWYFRKFQSTHLHEVWHRISDIELGNPCFNPHTYMRCDTSRQSEEEANQCFNPHTYMRCDFTCYFAVVASLSFNPHTYMRCDLSFNE